MGRVMVNFVAEESDPLTILIHIRSHAKTTFDDDDDNNNNDNNNNDDNNNNNNNNNDNNDDDNNDNDTDNNKMNRENTSHSSLYIRHHTITTTPLPHYFFKLTFQTQKTYEQAKEMCLGFCTKTQTSVNGFHHADHIVQPRIHPARTRVQGSSPGLDESTVQFQNCFI